MDIGKRIRELRDKRGMEQLELAQKVNVSQSKMNKIETGFQKRIEPDVLSDIAKVFGVKIDYLVNGDDEEDRKTVIIDKIKREFPDADLMFNDLASFTADDMQDVYDYIKFKKSQKDN